MEDVASRIMCYWIIGEDTRARGADEITVRDRYGGGGRVRGVDFACAERRRRRRGSVF